MLLLCGEVSPHTYIFTTSNSGERENSNTFLSSKTMKTKLTSLQLSKNEKLHSRAQIHCDEIRSLAW